MLSTEDSTVGNKQEIVLSTEDSTDRIYRKLFYLLKIAQIGNKQEIVLSTEDSRDRKYAGNCAIY